MVTHGIFHTYPGQRDQWWPLRICLNPQISPLYATVFVASMLFPALSTIIKEQMFTKAKETLKGKQLDIFVVRSFHKNSAL